VSADDSRMPFVTPALRLPLAMFYISFRQPLTSRMGEMEVQEPAASETGSKAAPQDTHVGGESRVAPRRTVLGFLCTAEQRKVSSYAVAGVILLLGSVIFGCLMFIEQQSRELGLLAPAPAAQTAAQPEPAAPEEVAPPPKPHSSPRRKPHEPSKIMASPSPQELPVELSINTQPQGAQIQIDGRSNGDWVTPYVAEQLTPGKHTVTLSKAGYRVESRTFELPAGKRLSVSIPLAELAALVAISSQPSDASVLVDGAETGHVTPTQIAVPKGAHTFTVRKAGYFDATSNVAFSPGQNSHLALALKQIRSDVAVQPVKKLRRLYGKPPAGMGWVQIRTIPKGAQISINRRPLDSPAPADFLLEIGDYEVTLTFNGYKPVRKVIHIEDGAKTEIEEVLERSY
jgi:hypothetical protein